MLTSIGSSARRVTSSSRAACTGAILARRPMDAPVTTRTLLPVVERTWRSLALAAKGFMPPDEGDALHAAALAAAAAVPGRAVRRDRLVLRALDDLAGRRRPRGRHGRVRRRPPPRARRRTSPGGSGTTRRSSTSASGRWTRCRSSGRRSTTPGWRTTSSPSSGGRPTSPATGRRRRRSCSSTAATAPSRPAPTTPAGRRTSPSAARWPSTTCSRIRPTAAGRRTRRSSCRRWRAAGSAWRRRPARCASCRRVD